MHLKRTWYKINYKTSNKRIRKQRIPCYFVVGIILFINKRKQKRLFFFIVSVSSDKIPSPSGNEWIVGNLQYLGYYLVNYDERNWNAIIDQLKTDPSVIAYIANRILNAFN